MSDFQPRSSIEVRLGGVLQAIPGRMAIAVSGGIDSLTLATFAHRALGVRVEMFHAVSPAVPGEATARVEQFAESEGWRLQILDAGEFAKEAYIANPVNRCYFCKTSLYDTIAQRTEAQILSGTNLDDLGEFRPGLEAARNHAVRHPYIEAEIDKKSVRSLALAIGLGVLSELPAAPCLSSRVETGIAIGPQILRAIHAIERELAKDFPFGVIRCRVRAKGIVIELDPETLAAIRGRREDDVRIQANRIFAGLVPTTDPRFAVYQNGSAFLHART